MTMAKAVVAAASGSARCRRQTCRAMRFAAQAERRADPLKWKLASRPPTNMTFLCGYLLVSFAACWRYFSALRKKLLRLTWLLADLANDSYLAASACFTPARFF